MPHNVVSSAYVMKLNCLLDFAISLMLIMKSIGPNIEPCGTPVVIYYRFDLVPLNSTNCWRSVK